MLKAKKIGHRLYSVARKQEFIDHINNLITNDCNYIKYQNKISKLIENGNLNDLGKELIWQPNTILSMITIDESKNSNNNSVNANLPYLYIVGRKTKSPKIFELFLRRRPGYAGMPLPGSVSGLTAKRRYYYSALIMSCWPKFLIFRPVSAPSK